MKTHLLGQLVLRYSWTLLFVWFGFQQLTAAQAWTSYLPPWTGYFPVPGEMLVQLNGLLELCLAALLALGAYTRVVAGLLAVHLAMIAFSVGGAVGVRDAALAATGFALMFLKPDAWTLDERRKNVSASTPNEPPQTVPQHAP